MFDAHAVAGSRVRGFSDGDHFHSEEPAGMPGSRRGHFKHGTGRHAGFRLHFHLVPPGHPNQLRFDVLFLASGVALILIGWGIARREQSSEPTAEVAGELSPRVPSRESTGPRAPPPARNRSVSELAIHFVQQGFALKITPQVLSKNFHDIVIIARRTARDMRGNNHVF